MCDQTDESMKETIERLIKSLASADLDICLAAARNLGELGDLAIDPVIKALRKPETVFGAIQALAFAGEPAIYPLIQLLSDASVDAFAAETLSKIGSDAVPALISTLDDQNDSLRYWATGILGWIGDRRAIEPLKRVVNDENAEVRKSAVRALNDFGLTTAEINPERPM